MPTTEVKDVHGCTDGRAFADPNHASAWQTIVNYFEDKTGRLNGEYKKLIKSDLNTIKYFIMPAGSLVSELVWGTDTDEKATTKQAAISAYIKYHNLPLPTYMGNVTNSTSIIWEKENNRWVNLTTIMNRIKNISTVSTNSNTNVTKYYLIDCLHADRDKDKKYSYKIENRQPLYANEEKKLIAKCKETAARETGTTANSYTVRLTLSDNEGIGYTEIIDFSLTQPLYEEPAYES